MTPHLSQLALQVAGFIQNSEGSGVEEPDQEFNRLACELFAAQFDANPAYRAYCESVGKHPSMIGQWSDIAYVPTTAFKDLEMTCLAAEERQNCFLSSATTGQARSRHFHSAESLRLYEISLSAWYKQFVADAFETSEEDDASRSPDGKFGVVALTPPPESAPQSSLVHMLGVVVQEFGARDSIFVGAIDTDGSWRLDTDRFLYAIRKSMCANRPLVLFGTAFNWVEVLDFLESRNIRYRLADGTRAVETGGYKGRSREIPKGELRNRMTQRLGIRPENIIGEYGMSELSSQAYETQDSSGNASGFEFPPWARARIISPETGLDAADGEPGLLQILDLANVASVCAIQTGDLAVAPKRGLQPASSQNSSPSRGVNSFHLLGRAPKTESRGCSLMSL